MSEHLRRFIHRSPRYLLRPQDRKIMRFSLEHSQGEGGIEQTLLLNLSETGVAFIVDAGVEPRVGEKVKVEIPIPGGDQIAWWGKVVRTSEYGGPGWFSNNKEFDTNGKVLVALRFEDDMPGAHTKAIRSGLEASFIQTLRDQQFRDWKYAKQGLLRKVGTLLFYFLIVAIALGFIYWFSLPGGNYDAKRGSPWGERFKF